MPGWPLTTSTRSAPRRPATSAMIGARRASYTPRSCRLAPAGLVSGPRMLKTVRMPISRRVGPAWRIDECSDCANRKPTPASSTQRPTSVGVERDVDAERLEHVGAPRCRGDRAVAVLGNRHARAGNHERRRGRDVEGVQSVAAGPAGVDVAARRWAAPGVACSRIARAKPTISSTVSPFMRMPVISALICDGVASPSMIWFMTMYASSSVSDAPVATRPIAAAAVATSAAPALARAAPPAAATIAGVPDAPLASGTSPATSRKFASSLVPSGVRTLSGWNCTPKTGSSRWWTPMMTPSGVRACTSARRARCRRRCTASDTESR